MAAPDGTPPPPSGGSLLQQLSLPPKPAAAVTPALTIRQPTSQTSQSRQAFPVRHIKITGNTLLSNDRLHALVASAEGSNITLAGLEQLAARITLAYQKHGYPLARAYVPAQTMQNGDVVIAVVEARYGAVNLTNKSSTANRPLNAALAALVPGQPVTEAALDRTLLLLSDIPGVRTSSTLSPGATPGTSDLDVNATNAARYSGVVGVDDFGNNYTGRARTTLTFNVNGLLHQGDQLGADALTSGSGMSYGRLSYRYLLDGEGTTLGGSLSQLHYKLSGALSPLQANGNARIGSLSLTRPFIRAVDGNLYGQLKFDHKVLHDNIDAAAIQADRHINAWTATLAGDHRDDHGITNFNVSASHGRVDFENPSTLVADSYSARTNGSYSKYGLTLARVQQLDPVNSLYVAFSAQLSNKNLDPAEQFYLGGPSNTRGFDVGALAGARGNLTTAEWRHALNLPGQGRWLLSTFVDRGHVQVYKSPFATGTNSSTLSDAGVGLHWSGSHDWVVSTEVATRVGPTSKLLRSDASHRIWIEVRKGF